MDMVFGAGNWADLRMADGDAPFLPGSGHTFIYLEGGDETALELNNYLTTYRTEIEAFVSNGGHLIINAAPNEGGDIDYGFGGVLLTYPAYSDSVTAADPLHPVFVGPFTPVVTDYTGDSFGHAIIGGAVSPIIIGAVGDGQEGNVILGEMTYGSGLVLFGGMTTDNFHSPQPEAHNLLANIISYAKEGGSNPAVSVPLSESAKALLVLLFVAAAFAMLYRRRPAV